MRYLPVTGALLILLVVTAGCSETARIADDRSALVIRGITLLDGTGGSPRPNATLVIEGNRIVQAGHAADVDVPRGARIVDGEGLYAMPGLWDLHVHLSKAKAEALPLLIANGVTSVRDMGGDLDELRALRRQIGAGELVGPRMLLAGPMFDSPEALDRLRAQPTRERWMVTRVAVPDSASAQTLVDSVAGLGVDFIKIREAVSPAVYAAVVRAALRNDLAVVGHPPYSMDPVEAAALGVASFEHASYPYPLDPDSAARTRILDAFREHGVAMVPTLVAWQVSLMDRDSLWALVQDSLGNRDPRRRLIADFLADEWRFDVEGDERKSDKSLKAWQGFFKLQADDLRAMHEAGIRMLPGSDLAGPSLFPGYALHDELGNLVEHVGLTPMEAIESATRHSAELLGLGDELGTLEVGKLADLVLLGANPVADIANTRRIVGVVADGRYYDEADIMSLLGGLTPQTRGRIDLVQHAEAEDEDS